jgi:hypothetical protein
LIFGLIIHNLQLQKANISMDNESEGIWSHILKNSPYPEHDEISQLIGKKLIDDNQV